MRPRSADSFVECFTAKAQRSLRDAEGELQKH
jgi:hypothetical protein